MIITAMAVGFGVARWVSAVVSMVFFASGLWFVGLLVLVATDAPRWASWFYARNRGVDFRRQSGIADRAWSGRSTLIVVAFLLFLLAVIAYNSVTGHPLITWSWRIDFADDVDAAAAPLVAGMIGLLIGWWIRRKRDR